MKILIINGPNMNLLGSREPDIYGTATYRDMIMLCEKTCKEKGATCICFQSNHEGEIVDAIQQAAKDGIEGIVINSAAYAHTSIAIMDALKAVGIPAVNVHVSDVSSREDFRQNDFTALACEKNFAGDGIDGYRLAIEYLVNRDSRKAMYNNLYSGL